jgi:hypothetical protein
MFLCNLNSQLSNDMLHLTSNHKQQLQMINKYNIYAMVLPFEMEIQMLVVDNALWLGRS